MKTSPFFTHTLACGLRLIVEPVPGPVAFCGLAVDAGTRDERPDQSGMAHLMEHLLFKGTRRRRACHILNRMERVGGSLDAFTQKEETVVYSAFLTADLPRAMELLVDMVFGSTFPQRELEREVEVIIDEIHSYEDEPSELIFDEFDELLFPHHPLGGRILGDAVSLRSFSRADVLAFAAAHYRPDRIVLFVRGEVDPPRVVRLASRLMAVYTPNAYGSPAESCDVPYRRPVPTGRPPQSRVRSLDTHQAHVMLGCRAYAADDERGPALCLLSNLLGGPGMNARLNMALRERQGLVYQVESNVTTYTDTGAFAIYFGCDGQDVDRCLSLTFRELSVLRRQPLSPSQLVAAQKQLVGQMGVASINHENNALAMAKACLHHHRLETLDDASRRILALTPEDVHRVAVELLDPDGLSTLIYR